MKNVYSVAQVNAYIKNMFTQDFMLSAIFIKGEVSNCKYHSSGHIYFTLKDNKGSITCVMFAGNRSGLQFRMQEGQQVIVEGSVEVYERDGKYQLYAKSITLQGNGLLFEQFCKLKQELEDRGMFAAEYKQPIPRYIKKLGVVTAPTGAAVQDIISIAGRRNPFVQVLLYPAIVQGEQAAESIVKGIHALEQLEPEVIIVGRGGGSIEDLWAFNEEIVANAIFECRIPIISAVGHETDTTIADYAADLRAPTPSAAAELAVYDVNLLLDRIEESRYALGRLLKNKIEHSHSRADYYRMKLQYLSPASQMKEKRTYLMKIEEKLQGEMKHSLLQNRHRLAILLEQMKGLSPLEKLNQGFTYTTDSKGSALRDVSQVEIGDTIHVQVRNGEVAAMVQHKKKMRRKLS